MKSVFAIGYCLLGSFAFGQNSRLDYTKIDQRAKSVKTTQPYLLAKQLTENHSTDEEKIRSIFRWITENIAYRTQQPRSRRKGQSVETDELDDTAALKPLDERVAENVIKNKLAVCDGYSRLFKTLCHFAGIEAEVITGYARTEASNPRQRFRSNHSWNAVKLDSVWYLLDVTWASGYLNRQGDMFIRYFDEEYYLTKPEKFIREHYPDDLKWALMTNPPVMSEFRFSPFKQKAFVKYNIAGYYPEKGLIEVVTGDTVQIEIVSTNPEKDSRISADPFLDTSVYNTSTTVLLLPEELPGGRFRYTYIVQSEQVEWLYLLYNDDLLLRYSILVRPAKSVVAIN
jgi:Transglutaminase-like superfamily